jgi:hypothetical protein
MSPENSNPAGLGIRRGGAGPSRGLEAQRTEAREQSTHYVRLTYSNVNGPALKRERRIPAHA